MRNASKSPSWCRSPHRKSRGHRGGGGVSGQRGGGLRHRPGPPGQRRVRLKSFPHDLLFFLIRGTHGSGHPGEVKRIIKEQLDVDEKDIKPESTFNRRPWGRLARPGRAGASHSKRPSRSNPRRGHREDPHVQTASTTRRPREKVEAAFSRATPFWCRIHCFGFSAPRFRGRPSSRAVSDRGRTAVLFCFRGARRDVAVTRWRSPY